MLQTQLTVAVMYVQFEIQKWFAQSLFDFGTAASKESFPGKKQKNTIFSVAVKLVNED